MQAVRMYTTEYCPYCIRAKQLLKERGVAQIEEIRIDEDPDQRRTMMESTGRRTVPQSAAVTIWWRWTARAVCCRCCRPPEIIAAVLFPARRGATRRALF